jgi:hypothetical protein
MRGSARIIAVAGLALASAAAAGDAEETRTDGAAARCGHIDELEAAKHAAELGDKEQMLLHLRKADALLARCLREGAPGPPMPAAPSPVEAG